MSKSKEERRMGWPEACAIIAGFFAFAIMLCSIARGAVSYFN